MHIVNNPLAFVDPSGFSEEEAWRLWHYEETPGQVGVHVTYDQLTPPRSRPESTAPADINARASTNDMGTTGDGSEATSPEATPEPIPAPGFWDGVQEGGVNALIQLPTMIPTETTTYVSAVHGTLNAIDAYQNGGIVDAINTANPLVGVVNLGFAIKDEDWYTVGVESVGVAVTIAAVIVGKKVMGKGAGTTRGPPKSGAAHEHHVMTNKNYVSGARGGPWSPKFEDMAKKAGMTLKDAENRVRIPGHAGPHPQAYHAEVHRRLQDVTRNLTGDAYTRAFRQELDRIRSDVAMPGSLLNRLITGN